MRDERPIENLPRRRWASMVSRALIKGGIGFIIGCLPFVLL
jgi:hypothetical protein